MSSNEAIQVWVWGTLGLRVGQVHNVQGLDQVRIRMMLEQEHLRLS